MYFFAQRSHRETTSPRKQQIKLLADALMRYEFSSSHINASKTVHETHHTQNRNTERNNISQLKKHYYRPPPHLQSDADDGDASTDAF